jgi:hypothetical protein
MLALRLTQSRRAYPRPQVEKREMITAMAEAAAKREAVPA